MSTPAKVRLQKLIEEEKIIKSMLLEIKSKYFKLQLEHMTLCRAQMNILSKCHVPQEFDDNIGTQVESFQVEDNNKISQQLILERDDEFYGNILLKNITMGDETECISGLPGHIECSSSYESHSDKEQCEEDLDDPFIMNQFKLNDGPNQALLEFSEVESSDEESK